MKKVGLCQRVNTLENTDSKSVVDIGECVLAPSTHVLVAAKPEFLHPCIMMAILYLKIEETTGKSCKIEKFERKLAENTNKKKE